MVEGEAEETFRDKQVEEVNTLVEIVVDLVWTGITDSSHLMELVVAMNEGTQQELPIPPTRTRFYSHPFSVDCQELPDPVLVVA